MTKVSFVETKNNVLYKEAVGNLLLSFSNNPVGSSRTCVEMSTSDNH